MKTVNMLMESGAVKSKYEGIYEIYPQKIMNTLTLAKLYNELKNNGYELVQVFTGWVRAFKK